jgi:RsiW-degrading membrane proteinase PrsW (M82 family)
MAIIGSPAHQPIDDSGWVGYTLTIRSFEEHLQDVAVSGWRAEVVKPQFRLNLKILALSVLLVLLFTSPFASAQEAFPADDLELARKYAPVLYFHPAELFRPQSIDVIVNTARLRQSTNNWFDANVLLEVTIQELLNITGLGYNIDIWYGDEGASDYKNYSAHRSYYEAVLSPEAGGPPMVTYAHVVHEPDTGKTIIQYWLFYYYNDWFNKHEGDWEMAQVILDSQGEPEWVVLSQHFGGSRRAWSTVQTEGDTHPVVYVALGSHANYFRGDELYPNGQDIGNLRVEIMDRTGSFGRVIPKVTLIPDLEEIQESSDIWQDMEWISYGGHWGELGIQSDFGGPLGPAFKGDKWESPYAWGMAQPLDTDIWYANRLRVEVTGEAAEGARVSLETTTGSVLADAEILGSVAVLHTDPPDTLTVVADIIGQPDTRYSLVATWPYPGNSQVIQYHFDDLPLNPTGQATLRMQAGVPPSLVIPGVPQEIRPTIIETKDATWDAPDFVWLAGLLPASEVVRGVAICLLAGLLPTMIYVGLLYWSDRYEKEPLHLLLAAFFWGAIPALVVAVTVRLFFNLPVDLLGPEAIEAVRAGIVTPLIEEGLKAIAVLYIARRFRLEFNNVLDGIIYGAMVGFGFAMTGNMVSYLGAFALRGFAGLSSTIFVQGVLYGVNHALYTAVFGAGLGYSMLSQDRKLGKYIPPSAFVLAVASNALHNLAVRNSVGVNVLTATLTWAGVVVIIIVMVWSLTRQRSVITVELADEVPEAIYRTLTAMGGKERKLWQVLRKAGFGEWRRKRYLYQLSAELAFMKHHGKQMPEETEFDAEAQRLREELKGFLDDERLVGMDENAS